MDAKAPSFQVSSASFYCHLLEDAFAENKEFVEAHYFCVQTDFIEDLENIVGHVSTKYLTPCFLSLFAFLHLHQCPMAQQRLSLF